MILQFLQRAHTLDNLIRLRVTEKEITESHVLLDELMQIHIQFRGVLVDEMEALSLGLLLGGLRFRS